MIATTDAAMATAVPSSDDWPLPPGWRWARLGTVCMQDRQTIVPGSDLYTTRPYLSLEHVESNTGRILREPAEVIADEGQSTTFAFDSRHILYGKLRPYLNKVALPDFAGRCTTELIPLLPQGTDREFLAWILRRQETVETAMHEKTGSRMPRTDISASPRSWASRWRRSSGRGRRRRRSLRQRGNCRRRIFSKHSRATRRISGRSDASNL